MTSSAKRTGPRYAAAGLDPVDGLRLRLVEQLQRRPSSLEQDHAAALGAPVGELYEPERVTVERERLVEVRHRQRHS